VKGQERTYHLARHTLIIGDNGSGKSALTQALELALSGFASDIAGRNPRDKRIADLFPGEVAYVRALWSDGAESRFTMEDGKPRQTGRSALCMTDTVLDALKAGDDRLLATVAGLMGVDLPTRPAEALKAARADVKARKALLAEMKNNAPRSVVRPDHCPSCQREVDAAMWDDITRARHEDWERQVSMMSRQVTSMEAYATELSVADKKATEDAEDTGRRVLSDVCGLAGAYLPLAWHLAATMAGPVRVTLDRGRGAHAALSGGEWALSVAAMGAAIAAHREEPALVVVEDRGLSLRTLASVLPRLGESPCQVVLPTVAGCDDEETVQRIKVLAHNEAWSVIRV
jgi:energy-coupling factor transporter ATP-binding protein EcfA2